MVNTVLWLLRDHFSHKYITTFGVLKSKQVIDSRFCFTGLITRLSNEVLAICFAKGLKSSFYCHEKTYVLLDVQNRWLRERDLEN